VSEYMFVHANTIRLTSDLVASLMDYTKLNKIEKVHKFDGGLLTGENLVHNFFCCVN
jgi:hypothetical protein